jgi:hypothetical protein
MAASNWPQASPLLSRPLERTTYRTTKDEAAARPTQLGRSGDRTVGGLVIGNRSPLTGFLILRWADNHHGRTGAWPRTVSADAASLPPEDSWRAIDLALRQGAGSYRAAIACPDSWPGSAGFATTAIYRG